MPYTHQDLSENHSYTLTQLLETHDLPKINKIFHSNATANENAPLVISSWLIGFHSVV